MEHPIAFGFAACPVCHQQMHVRTLVDGPDTLREENCSSCQHFDKFIIVADERGEPECLS